MTGKVACTRIQKKKNQLNQRGGAWGKRTSPKRFADEIERVGDASGKEGLGRKERCERPIKAGNTVAGEIVEDFRKKADWEGEDARVARQTKAPPGQKKSLPQGGHFHKEKLRGSYWTEGYPPRGL